MVSVSNHVHAQTNAEHAAILETVSTVFEGINTSNGDLIRSVMAPSAILYATSDRNGIPQYSLTTAEQFAAGVSDPNQGFVERMFETDVEVRNGIATVWAQYDFHVKGTFSHCGVDTFSLVKGENAWKIVSIVYTVERDNCPERPGLE